MINRDIRQVVGLANEIMQRALAVNQFASGQRVAGGPTRLETFRARDPQWAAQWGQFGTMLAQNLPAMRIPPLALLDSSWDTMIVWARKLDQFRERIEQATGETSGVRSFAGLTTQSEDSDSTLGTLKWIVFGGIGLYLIGKFVLPEIIAATGKRAALARARV